MGSFKDSSGRRWEVNVTIGAVKRVKSLIDVDLTRMDKGDPPLLTRIGTDIALLADIIYCLCKPEADRFEIDDEQFGELLNADVLMAAHDVFYKELIDFFRKLNRRDVSQAIQNQLQIISEAVDQVALGVENLDATEIVGKAFTSLQESAESAQTD